MMMALDLTARNIRPFSNGIKKYAKKNEGYWRTARDNSRDKGTLDHFNSSFTSITFILLSDPNNYYFNSMPITLAIVEDLDEVREGLNNFLALDPEFKVLDTYKTGEEASVDIPRLKPDIVIMDINLPGMSGIDCCKATKNKISPTQFMMFTVYENDEKVFEALKAGASGYLLKNTGLIQWSRH